MTIRVKSQPTLANDLRSSLNFSLFNRTLFLRDQSTVSSSLVCAFLCFIFPIISELVVSSTYFQRNTLFRAKSLIIIRNDHGLNVVPCETRERTAPNLETQPSKSLILWDLCDKKSIIQLIMLTDKSSKHNFLTRIL